MTFSLYRAIVPTYQQFLDSLAGLLDTAEKFCADKAIASSDIIQARLAPDMLPFSYQVKSGAIHSWGAIQGVRKGVFSPDVTPPPETFAALKSRVAEARGGVAAVQPAEIDAWIGRDMRFEFGERRMDFTAEDFLLSFSQPNFFFHITTAYDILRWKGVPIGKRNYLGRLRLKQ